MVTTDDDALAASVRRLAAHGSDGGYIHKIVGTNSRLDPIQAAILRVKLGRFDDGSQARARNAELYNTRFAGHPALLPPPRPFAGRLPVYHQYVIRVRMGIAGRVPAALGEHGIDTGIYYPLPLHLQECFAALGGQVGRPARSPKKPRAPALPFRSTPTLTAEEVELRGDPSASLGGRPGIAPQDRAPIGRKPVGSHPPQPVRTGPLRGPGGYPCSRCTSFWKT